MARDYENMDESMSDGVILSESESHKKVKKKSVIREERHSKDNITEQNKSNPREPTQDINMRNAESFLEAIRDEVIIEDALPPRSSGTQVNIEKRHKVSKSIDSNKGTGNKHSFAGRHRENIIWEGSFDMSSTSKRTEQLIGSLAINNNQSHVATRGTPGVWLIEPGLRTTGISLPHFDVSETAAKKAQLWGEGANTDQ